ncbi:hypothetical protein SK803_37205 [Lentzea sp. BCCO 10_0856]|uniref:Chromosome segregation ATPase n=1 Tax=Lentzea miocenica TaxID=3095431 RepID=A0ABU4TCG1_9PSEU|nr:hypothetical protein [Lentzea sp. BCCO 10_0856]MDX8035869.1 hypothetical protein [Lentzea sp. BCCO 10_0856]
MRIERHGPEYVQVRWAEGVHLANGDTEKARVANAEEIWESLRGQKTLKVTEYAEAFFGKAPRCIAYIRARGSEDNQDRGLLALGQRPFRPIDLANQIINLAGKRHALEYERQFRLDLAASQTALEAKRQAYEVQYQREERELQEIANRRRSRDQLAVASKFWDMFLTIGAILEHEAAESEAEKLAELGRKIEETEYSISQKTLELRSLADRATLVQRLDLANGKLNGASTVRDNLLKESGAKQSKRTELEREQTHLLKVAALASDISVAAAEVKLVNAEQRWLAAGTRKGIIGSRRQEKCEHLEKLEAGRGGPAGLALEALEAEGIRAVSVLDLINLSEDSRVYWEARLSPYVNAIVLIDDDNAAVVDRARLILACHPGTPVIINAPTTSLSGGQDADPETSIENFLGALQKRMPTAEPDWVVDLELKLEIPGGYSVPLTDRQAAIAAVQAELEELDRQQQEALRLEGEAKSGVEAAKAVVEAAKAAVEANEVSKELKVIDARLRELEGLAESAEASLGEARENFKAAQDEILGLDKRIAGLKDEIDRLRSGEDGTTVLRQKLADARQKASLARGVASSWKEAAAIQDIEVTQERLEVESVVVSGAARDAAFHQSRTGLRYAIAAVHVVREGEDAIAGRTPGVLESDELNQKLNGDLTELYLWSEAHHAAIVRSFESVSRPLVAWLEWNGAEDHAREEEIDSERRKNKEEIDAAEHRAGETREWIASQREMQIAIIDKAFRDTEKTLNNLLRSVNKDPIRLRPRNTDVQDVEQPLRWELHPQWIPLEGKPVEYTNPPNTAELIILHVLLATASLVAATSPRGRMLILDESGNNLDGPNLSKVSAVLKQISETHGLTIVLACQDIYTDRVARFSAGVIQLLRHSRSDALNAPPTMMHGREEAELVDVLLPYLRLARPTGSG